MSEFAQITSFDGAVAYKRGLIWRVEWPAHAVREDRWGGFSSVKTLASKNFLFRKRAEGFMRARRELAACHAKSEDAT